MQWRWRAEPVRPQTRCRFFLDDFNSAPQPANLRALRRNAGEDQRAITGS
jgi:hypothetical protein